MPSCDDCGVVLDSMYDLQRHIKTWCPESESLKRKRKTKIQLKRMHLKGQEANGLNTIIQMIVVKSKMMISTKMKDTKL